MYPHRSKKIALLVLIASLSQMFMLVGQGASDGILIYRVGRPKTGQYRNSEVGLTLITGDTVMSAKSTNGLIEEVSPSQGRKVLEKGSYMVLPADPTEMGYNYMVLQVMNRTYIFPKGVDTNRLDVELFDVDYLFEEDYHKLNYLPVIVEYVEPTVAGISREGIIKGLKEEIISMGGTVTKEFKVIPAISAHLPLESIKNLYEALVKSVYLEKIWLNKGYSIDLNESVPLIRAPEVWTLDFNGSGIEIAILDTGIDSTHPDLNDMDDDPATVDPKVIREVSFVPYEDPMDYHGHGTHCAGISAGTGEASGGRIKGVAPGAWLWNVKVLNKTGYGYEDWIISGIEYAAYGPDGKLGTGDEANVISMSLGGGPTDGTDPVSKAVNAAVDAGIVTCVAAGNAGNDFWVTTPGVARGAITVGATTKEDTIAWFSSRGPTIDLRIKPDVVEPGVRITSSVPYGIYNTYYMSWSGTSMATPHVAGLAALLLQAGWSPRDVKDRLVSTAIDLGYNVYTQGGGRIDAYESVMSYSYVTPSTISFGVFTTNDMRTEILNFYNLNMTHNKTLDLMVKVVDVVTGAIMNCTSLNTTAITIPPGQRSAVELRVNATVPKSVYSGKLLAEDAATNETIHAIFGFARLNNVTARCIDFHGNSLMDAHVLATKYNVTSNFEYNLDTWRNYYSAHRTDRNGLISLLLTDGEFYIIGLDRNYSTQTDVWTVADKLPVYTNIDMLLDERDTDRVDFDPNKLGQVFLGKLSSLTYRQESPLVWINWQSSWFYPTTTTTYVSRTTLIASFAYQYYPESSMSPYYPYLVNAPEWHNLLYTEPGITPPKHYVANYAELVRRETRYKVGMSPRVTALIYQSAYSKDSYSWVWHRMDVPCSRIEWLSPDIWYLTSYSKAGDRPWISTPYWYFAHWPYLMEGYLPGDEITESFAEHPLSTHFLVNKNSDSLEVITDISMDTYGHSLWADFGHIWMYQNDGLILDQDVKDFLWYRLMEDPRPAKYRVIIEGWSSLYLSTYVRTQLDFTVTSGTADYRLPVIYVRIPKIDLNCTHPSGNVDVTILFDESNISRATLEYSVDDGATWRQASLRSTYTSRIRNLKDVYVSLRVNATDIEGNSISQTTIRGFFVRPAGQ